ncbi:UDP-N-acetylglucosamine 2-epimerase (chromatophore) [Paulinella micropora]|uniref:UDP-N-acetylglucosamine 2-epimerase (non-hydrolyzing) n=1 Tax=Paulinella micropora TaxID=1928728 RepID=A0A1L5YCT1_9EUKA|nr:UDP-N-acetylglucosamine 2-epimerase [Paulinella micropora]AQX45277.1 UDP-N-acetylglucosamine 2-epimerase [Paulinella micropora]BBL86495.1 UDP-N-acetylglucosamine 2-epimerase [Paulinella micropora]
MEHSSKINPLVSIVLGTRPEAIKLAPVIMSFQECTALQTRIIFTGQHREMVNQIMELFEISLSKDLGLKVTDQTPSYITSSILQELKEEFHTHPPNLVLVQGDTTAAFASALTAFYEQIPVAHIEAGLRTNNISYPFPEEGNRCLISQLTSLHFSPTIQSAANLRAAGVTGEIHVTGNTVIDSLLLAANKSTECTVDGLIWENYKVILVTVNRRENWGPRLNDIALGLLRLLEIYPNVALVLPLNTNPIVRGPIKNILNNHPRAFLIEPLAYDKWITAMRNCTLILTDSGGIQEEAPTFGKPVLVLRDATERLESVQAGTARLIGTKPIDIVKETSILIDNPEVYSIMSRSYNPFGDGQASNRILAASRVFLDC